MAQMHISILAPRYYSIAAALFAGMLLLAMPAQADPAGRIGRIALVSGNVYLSNPDTGEEIAAPLNQPLTSGDILTTDPGSRAEIQIGSTTVRLDSDSRLEFDRIDDDQVSVFLNDGRAIVKLTTSDAVNDFELETRNGRFKARDDGIYRFEAEPGRSSAAVYYGALHFESGDNTLDIGAGQGAQFWFSDGTRYRLSNVTNDDFSRWSALRDQQARSNTYSRYVSPEMTGAEDLDAYGDWEESPDYGAVWYPRSVAADWAPYRTGHWAWVAPWGWSWVGHEPWGFAPFHYGRWVHHRGMWGWVPGERIARPVYAPAMVAWVGTPGVSLSLSIGSPPKVGWFPLAPREVYIPIYRSSPNHVRRINITHVPHVANVANIVSNPYDELRRAHYNHRDLPRAVTSGRPDAFTWHQPDGRSTPTRRENRDWREQPRRGTSEPSASPPVARIDVRSSPERVERLERGAPPRPQPQTYSRDSRESREPMAAPRARPERQEPAPALAAPQAPVPASVRNERPNSEITRSRIPEPRSEPIEPRIQERPARREEPAQRQPRHEVRAEQTPQQLRPPRPASPPAVKTVQRPPEPQSETRTQRRDDRQRPDKLEDDPRRHRRDEARKG